MKINKHHKLDLIVSKDPVRLALQRIFISKDSAIASDGKIMAIVPIELNEEDNKNLMIDPEILQIARGSLLEGEHNLNIELNDSKAILSNGISIPLQLQLLPANETYPDYKELIPAGDPKYSFTIDSKQLSKLSKAFGCSRLILGFYDDSKPIRVIPLSETSKEVGLIMPIKNELLENDKETKVAGAIKHK